MLKPAGAARPLTENMRDILDRATASAANSRHGIAWVLDGGDSQTLIDWGLLVEIERSKYGNLIMVRVSNAN